MRLSARIMMSPTSSHAEINVWQDGGLAGMLTVDAAEADEVVTALNLADAAPDLLAACKAALSLNEGTHTGVTAEHVNKQLEAAIAKAEGTP